MSNLYLNELEGVAKCDVAALLHAKKSYGDSWKKRGGTGAFMMLARKWDRLENAASKVGYDVFAAVADDKRAEGTIDDIRDLRRYLMLVEAELIATHRCPGKLAKDIEAGTASKGGSGFEAFAADSVSASATPSFDAFLREVRYSLGNAFINEALKDSISVKAEYSRAFLTALMGHLYRNGCETLYNQADALLTAIGEEEQPTASQLHPG